MTGKRLSIHYIDTAPVLAAGFAIALQQTVTRSTANVNAVFAGILFIADHRDVRGQGPVHYGTRHARGFSITIDHTGIALSAGENVLFADIGPYAIESAFLAAPFYCAQRTATVSIAIDCGAVDTLEGQ